MSMMMSELTIRQTVFYGLAYLFITAALPGFLFRRKLQGRRLAQKFMICFMLGNFYIMNLVYILQLLHLSYRITLILGTVLPVVIGKIKMDRIPIRAMWMTGLDNARRLSIHTMGPKQLWARFYDNNKEKAKRTLLSCWHGIWTRIPDWICLAGFFLFFCWFYGCQLTHDYGYTASDVPVHLYWINEMGNNHIFTAGVYPFGFHCIIYYLHAVFRIDTYALLRVFWFPQTLLIHLMLVGFIRLCCKNKYLCYAATFFYVANNYMSVHTYNRYFATLPQEFGMLFLLPSIYFLFAYFKQKEKELKEGLENKESRLYLVMFAMSFSMTLTVHFYGTMIAGLYCVAIAVGFVFWFVRPAYFREIMVSGILSVVVAVLPMLIAFLMGTPLQGSLGWGMNIINGSSEESRNAKAVSVNEESENGNQVLEFDANGNLVSVTVGDEEPDEVLKDEKEKKPFKERVTDAWENGIKKEMYTWMFNENMPRDWYAEVILWIIVILSVEGILYFLLGKRHYGSILLSTGIVLLILTILMGAADLGLPPLMEPRRCCIYLTYILMAGMAFVADGFLSILFWAKPLRLTGNTVSLACVVVAACFLHDADTMRPQIEMSTFQTNEAITCLTNVLAVEKDFTWTILSAGDELQMGIDHGYHYEISTFIRKMEKSLKNQDPELYFPTPEVYVYIEKIPLDYSMAYQGSGQNVSIRGAIRPIPTASGNFVYKGENRWILMSKMYCWAQAFSRLYPNEMQVYLETDQFVCYKVTQNPYRLFNFAIDYGYNSW